MKNNFWEEKQMEPSIGDFHESSLEKMDIPEWMNINCPFCSNAMPLRSIRSFGLKLNTRNKGDIFVEFLCEDCGLMDTVYFRKQVKKVSDLNDFISGERIPDCKPVVEEDMYILQYNNVLEERASERK